MAAAVETQNLSKTYGLNTGCRNISLMVEEGEVFGFLGPNGAGKSTFVKMLTGLLSPTSGQGWLLGKPITLPAARQAVGYLPEKFAYHPWLTALEILELHGRLSNLRPAEISRRSREVLVLAGLAEKGGKRVGSFSKGMQQRLGLAVALVADPKLLLLDEPTSALDPLGRREVRQLIQALCREGKTIFLNTHLLTEAEQLCNRVAVINRGEVVSQGTLEELQGGGVQVDIRLGGDIEAVKNALAFFDDLTAIPGGLRVNLAGEDEIPLVARTIIEAGGNIYALMPRYSSLEDVFIQLVEKGGEA